MCCPPQTAVCLSLMRRRPITSKTTFHPCIKGKPLLCRPKRRQWRECLTLTFHSFAFVKADFDERKKKPFPPFCVGERNICLVFSEIEMMEVSSHGSNLQDQPSQPITSLSISVFCLPFKVYSSFLACFPHCAKSKAKPKPPELKYLPHQHCHDFRTCPDVQYIRLALSTGPSPTDI